MKYNTVACPSLEICSFTSWTSGQYFFLCEQNGFISWRNRFEWLISLFFQTSAKNCDNVDRLFTDIAHELLQQVKRNLQIKRSRGSALQKRIRISSMRLLILKLTYVSIRILPGLVRYRYRYFGTFRQFRYQYG